MVHFDESCVFRGPVWGKGAPDGEVFISYYRGVTEVWPLVK